MIIADNHLHTNFSDGTNSPDEMIRAALSLGIQQITFTDHVRANSTWVDRYIDEIHRLSEKYYGLIKVSVGVETKIIDFKGTLDCSDSLITNNLVEKVAAIHRIPSHNGSFIRRVEISDNPEMALKYYLQTIEGLKNNPYVNRLAHPFSLFDSFKITEKDIKRWRQIGDILERLTIPFELNVKYNNRIVPTLLWKKNVHKIVIGSDSHSTNDLRERYKKIFEANQLLNKFKCTDSSKVNG